ACAVTAAGGVKCWGNNVDGSLGDGSNKNSPVPVDVVGLSAISSVIAGHDDKACALDTTGSVFCWGLHAAGMMQTGDSRRNVPIKLEQLGGVTAISVGSLHVCVLQGSYPKCLGDSTFNELGQNLPDLAQISAGDFYTCGATLSGSAECWGDNEDGTL